MKSMARVKKWPNTLEAERKKKDQDRLNTLVKDEVSILKFIISFYQLFCFSLSQFD